MTKTQVSVAELSALGYATGQPGLPGVKGKGSKNDMFATFPLLTLSLLGYALMGVTVGPDWADQALPAIPMANDHLWIIHYGDIFLAFSLIFLGIEIVRATDTGTSSIVNHVISAFLFVVCFALFLMVPLFSSSAFFLMTMMAGVDFSTGIWITVLAARRDFGVS